MQTLLLLVWLGVGVWAQGPRQDDPTAAVHAQRPALPASEISRLVPELAVSLTDQGIHDFFKQDFVPPLGGPSVEFNDADLVSRWKGLLESLQSTRAHAAFLRVNPMPIEIGETRSGGLAEHTF